MKFIKSKIYVHEYADGSVKYSGVAIFRKNWFIKIRYCLSKDSFYLSTNYWGGYFLSSWQPVKYRRVFDSEIECADGLDSAIRHKIITLNANTIIKTKRLTK
jgi:hypothetical protein